MLNYQININKWWSLQDFGEPKTPLTENATGKTSEVLDHCLHLGSDQKLKEALGPCCDGTEVTGLGISLRILMKFWGNFPAQFIDLINL